MKRCNKWIHSQQVSNFLFLFLILSSPFLLFLHFWAHTHKKHAYAASTSRILCCADKKFIQYAFPFLSLSNIKESIIRVVNNRLSFYLFSFSLILFFSFFPFYFGFPFPFLFILSLGKEYDVMLYYCFFLSYHHLEW